MKTDTVAQNLNDKQESLVEDEKKAVLTISNNGELTLEFIPERGPDEVSLRTVLATICLKEWDEYIWESLKPAEKARSHA